MRTKEHTWETIIEVEQPKVIHFSQGLAGFSDTKAFVMLGNGNGDIACMQSTERPEASFLVTPWDKQLLGSQPELTPEQSESLQYPDKHQILWLLVLNPFTDSIWVLANLRAPLAINVDTASGMQCIQADPLLDLHFHWMRQPCHSKKQAA